MTFTTWMNDYDLTRHDPDIVGAVAMVPITANEVAVASPYSRKIVIFTQPLRGGGVVTVSKSKAIEHKFSSLSYGFDNRLYATCKRTTTKPGHIYIFNRTNLSSPVYKIQDDYVNGPILAQPALTSYIYGRSDRPSIVARSKTTNAVVDEIQTTYRTARIWGDLLDQGLLYCSNDTNNTIERIRWDEANQTFTHIDLINLPYASGILDLFARDGEVLYTTNENVVHYDIENDSVSLNYHDFQAKIGQLAPVEGIDFGNVDDPDLGNLKIKCNGVFDDPDEAETPDSTNRTASAVLLYPPPAVLIPAGTYRISYEADAIEEVLTFDGGTSWTVATQVPGFGAGAYQGCVINSNGTRIPFPTVTSGTGHLGDGFFDTVENCRAAYDGAYVDVVHPGGFFSIEFWDTNSTNTQSSGPLRKQQYRFEVISITGEEPAPPVTDGIVIDGTPYTVYQHPNIDGTLGVTSDTLKTWEDERLKGDLSRQFRDKFSPPKNGFLEEIGEMYGTKEHPYEVQFRDIGPKFIVRTVNSAYIFLDPDRGVIGFTGSLVFRYQPDSPSVSRASDLARSADVTWESYLAGDDPNRVGIRNAPSQVGYPNVPSVYLPGISGKAYGRGKNWNAKFFAGDVTIMAWIKPEPNEERNPAAASGAGDYQRIVSTKETWNDANGTFDLNLRMRTSSGEDIYSAAPFAEVFGSSPLFPGSSWVRSIDGLTKLQDGQWHFLVGILGAGTGRIYLDNVDVTGYSAAGAVEPGTVPLAIGKISGTDPSGDDLAGDQPDFYKGWLGEIRIYNESITLDRMNDVWEKTRAYYGR